MTRKRAGRHAVIAAASALAIGFFATVSTAEAGELSYFGGAAGTYQVHITTLKELKFRTVIRQRYDFSCGSAAIATLLSYHYNRPTNETAVFADMWEHGDRAKIEKQGFSMLDMQQYLARHGLRANGFRSTLDRLIKANVPAVVLLNIGGYLHFVIVEGIRQGRVLLADPASGTRVLGTDDFTKYWNGIFFVVLDDVEDARKTFNRTADWDVQPRAPLEMARNTTSLSNFLLSLPARNVF